MYGLIGGNTDAQLVCLKSVVNAIGESEPQEASAGTLHGWLDMTGGDSRYTTYHAKTEEATHVFVADWVQLPEDFSPENCRLLCGGKRYDVLQIDNPMGMGDGSQLEIYLRYTGGAAQCWKA